jgi:hypothetical protein
VARPDGATDMYLILDGRRIAKRGKPGTPHAMTWISPLAQVKREAIELLTKRMERAAAEAFADKLAGGHWTHDYALTATSSRMTGSRNRSSLSLAELALRRQTRGGRRMRESRTYGSALRASRFVLPGGKGKSEQRGPDALVEPL